MSGELDLGVEVVGAEAAVGAGGSKSAKPVKGGHTALAWGVHLLTASGAVFGMLAVLSIGAGELSRAALLMLLTLLIDSVDGTLARAARVAQILPRIDGRRLDDIVDYFNYAIVPPIFMVAAGNLPAWGWAALPILASAYGFSQQNAKTEDDFFLGWPSYWNVLALYLWLFDFAPLPSILWTVGLSVAVFVPVKYVYPSKLPVLRRSTSAGGVAWGLCVTAAILFPGLAARLWLVELSLVYPIYYVLLSFWLAYGPRR